jgi:hypothetical protein
MVQRSRVWACVLVLGTGLAGAIGAVSLSSTPAGASGTTLYVATPANGGSDTNDCSQASPCATISYALSQAASGDTISIGDGTFTDSVTIPDSMDITVVGMSVDDTTIGNASGDEYQPVFTVPTGASLSISALALSGGAEASEIYNTGGDLTADGVDVESKGIIESYSGTTDVTNSTFSDDSDLQTYAGITASGDTFTDSSAFASEGETSTLTDSSCTGGGAIYASGGTMMASSLTVSGCGVEGGAGTLDISNSTFDGNSGGGIYDVGGDVSVSGSTLTGTNVANESGTTTLDTSTLTQDEIYSGSNGAGSISTDFVATDVTNSTLSKTDAYGDAGTMSLADSTLSDSGYVDQYGGTVELFGSIVNEPCYGTINDDGDNLDYSDGAANSCGFSAAQNDVVEADPQLGPLQPNGGPTDTEAITASSPAYHQIPVAQCPATDQRGQSRPQPSDSPTCDIGSFEAVPAAPSTPTVSAVSPSSGPVAGGTSITITGTGFIAGARVVIGQGSGTSGAIAATVTSIAPTSITATTGGGAKAGTFNVFVTTSGGTSTGNSHSGFTYT